MFMGIFFLYTIFLSYLSHSTQPTNMINIAAHTHKQTNEYLNNKNKFRIVWMGKICTARNTLAVQLNACGENKPRLKVHEKNGHTRTTNIQRKRSRRRRNNLNLL